MNTIKQVRLTFALLLFVTAMSANAATIDKISLATFGHYIQSYNYFGTGDSQTLDLGSPDVYSLNNGSTWLSGAGGYYTFRPSMQSVQQNGNVLTYTLSTPTDGVMWNYTDYDSGSHSSNGTLSLVGNNLSLIATSGSNTAILSGFVKITNDTYANYTDSRFNFYSAPVGAIVPFEVTFTTYAPQGWTATSASFQYNIAGQIDFTSPVPLPATAWLLGSGLLGLVSVARKSKST